MAHYIIVLSSYSWASSINSIGMPCVIPLLIQLFMHSPLSIVRLPSWHLSHDIVRRAPEKTRSGSADIAGIERMSMAIFERRGYRCDCSSRSHQVSGEQSIAIGVLVIKDLYSSSSLIAGPTTSSSCASKSYSSRVRARGVENSFIPAPEAPPRTSNLLSLPVVI
jgi:hypothetical protein